MANPHEPKIYNVYDHDGKLYMSGLATEIAESLYLDPATIREAARGRQKTILREYTVIDTGECRHI